MRIAQRFARLVGNKNHLPLCVCRLADGTVQCITANLIEATFRNAAARVCKLDPVRDKCSSRSGRSTLTRGLALRSVCHSRTVSELFISRITHPKLC
jgi:hypothetical protein